jgi:acyl-coenzyme A synthetase/AMP-(fatty) acid ligase
VGIAPPNIVNLNEGPVQISNGKISPTPTAMISSGQKMIIPAHQIKIVKKDGTSPSPDSRGFFTLKQQSPQMVAQGISSGYNTQGGSN